MEMKKYLMKEKNKILPILKIHHYDFIKFQ